MGRRKLMIGISWQNAYKEASQTRPSVAVALSGQAPWRRAARPGPSLRKKRLLRMTNTFDYFGL